MYLCYRNCQGLGKIAKTKLYIFSCLKSLKHNKVLLTSNIFFFLNEKRKMKMRSEIYVLGFQCLLVLSLQIAVLVSNNYDFIYSEMMMLIFIT